MNNALFNCTVNGITYRSQFSATEFKSDYTLFIGLVKMGNFKLKKERK